MCGQEDVEEGADVHGIKDYIEQPCWASRDMASIGLNGIIAGLSEPSCQ